jgi:hypothetical protein
MLQRQYSLVVSAHQIGLSFQSFSRKNSLVMDVRNVSDIFSSDLQHGARREYFPAQEKDVFGLCAVVFLPVNTTAIEEKVGRYTPRDWQWGRR